jgi:hypothetical protein
MQKATKLFSIYMLYAHDIAIDERNLAWEAITFCHDELDDQVVPVEDLRNLPNPLTILTSLFQDENGGQWLFGLAIEDQLGRWLYAWIVKNGEIVTRNIPFVDGVRPLG